MAAKAINRDGVAAAAPAQPEAHRLRAVAGYFSDADSGEMDRLIYERVRLGIMSALSVNRSMSFSELRDLLRTTDGNLSKHARKLEDAGFITCRKTFAGRMPKTEFSLTTSGRRRFERHLSSMESLIRATRGE